MSARLDPWTDASRIADRLNGDDGVLVVVIGAEQWCSRCRALRPVFDRLAADAPEHEVWLWLDLEEHAEFIGEYVPESLPVLLTYRGDRVTTNRLVEDTGPTLDALVTSARRATVSCAAPAPAIRERLMLADWALEPAR